MHLCSSAVCVFIPSIDRTATRSLFLRLRACARARAHARLRARAISVRTGPCMRAWEAGFESEALPPAQVGAAEAPEPRSRSLANVRRNV